MENLPEPFSVVPGKLFPPTLDGDPAKPHDASGMIALPDIENDVFGG
jgi:hypothetical protein